MYDSRGRIQAYKPHREFPHPIKWLDLKFIEVIEVPYMIAFQASTLSHVMILIARIEGIQEKSRDKLKLFFYGSQEIHSSQAEISTYISSNSMSYPRSTKVHWSFDPRFSLGTLICSGANKVRSRPGTNGWARN